MKMEKVKAKIIGMSFAHRKGRNTAFLVLYALKAAEKFGRRISEVAEIETEFIDSAGQPLEQCMGCDDRHEMTNLGDSYKGHPESPREFGCRIKDDFMARVILPKIAEGDGFIFGSPVHSLGVSGRFKTFTDRMTHAIWHGHTYGKPAGVVTVATLPFGAQELALRDMNTFVQGCEMIPVSWLMGAPGISGPPYGPAPSKDNKRELGVKKDRYAQWLCIVAGRRVAEFAVMRKLAMRGLGEIYEREFMHRIHPPFGDEPWVWSHLDKKDEQYMDSITSEELNELGTPRT